MIEWIAVICAFVITAIFFLTWFLGEEANYKNGTTSGGVYYGVGFGVGGVLLAVSVVILIWAINKNRARVMTEYKNRNRA